MAMEVTIRASKWVVSGEKARGIEGRIKILLYKREKNGSGRNTSHITGKTRPVDELGGVEERKIN